MCTPLYFFNRPKPLHNFYIFFSNYTVCHSHTFTKAFVQKVLGFFSRKFEMLVNTNRCIYQSFTLLWCIYTETNCDSCPIWTSDKELSEWRIIKLLSEFQTRDLLQLLSIFKQTHKPPKKRKNISLRPREKRCWGWAQRRRILTSVYPLSVAKLWSNNLPYRKAVPDPGRMAPACRVRGH